MRLVRVLAMIGAMVGGYLTVSGAPASAAPLASGAPVAAAVTGGPLEGYMQYRGYRRHYAPRRYYAPRRAYRPVYRPYGFYGRRYARPRVVCRIRHSYYGPRRVCW
jgi:hypothetical protein